MKRDIYQKLLEWKKSTQRKPLILQGARQVGKTYILKEFGQKEYNQVAYFNFEEDVGLKTYFEGKLDPQKIVQKLEIHQGKKIDPQNCLIIFDEIQESSQALNSLKYFCENASQYHVATAGSLLGIKLGNQKSFPVGKVNFLHLYPLTFFEFLDALGKSHLRELIEKIKGFAPFDSPIHQELMEDVRFYFIIGGMPEAVQSYTQEKDLTSVQRIHQEILKSYILDFAKHAAPAQAMRISTVWESIPSQLAKENKKFIFSIIKKSARAREYESAIQWLLDAGLAFKASHISKPYFPLAHYADPHTFKLYLLDIGLLSSMSRLAPQVVLKGNQLFTEFKGALTENYVAQQLTALFSSPLYYWTSQGIAEVDFVLDHDGTTYPLEVKSGLSQKSRNLRIYEQKYQPPILSRVSPLNLKRDGGIANYPLYALLKFPQREESKI